MSKAEDQFKDALRRMSEAGLPPHPTDAKAAMESLREDLDSGVFDSQAELLARILLARYRAMVKAGFTEAQALYIVGK